MRFNLDSCPLTNVKQVKDKGMSNTAGQAGCGSAAKTGSHEDGRSAVPASPVNVHQLAEKRQNPADEGSLLQPRPSKGDRGPGLGQLVRHGQVDCGQTQTPASSRVEYPCARMQDEEKREEATDPADKGQAPTMGVPSRRGQQPSTGSLEGKADDTIKTCSACKDDNDDGNNNGNAAKDAFLLSLAMLAQVYEFREKGDHRAAAELLEKVSPDHRLIVAQNPLLNA